MERRFLTGLDDHNKRPGAFASRWEGWIEPRPRASLDHADAGRHNITTVPSMLDRLEARAGVYAFLYRASRDSLYALYIGVSRDLAREVEFRDREMDVEDARLRVTVRYISNVALACAYEDDLIRYYCPPWNTRFSRQAHRPRPTK